MREYKLPHKLGEVETQKTDLITDMWYELKKTGKQGDKEKGERVGDNSNFRSSGFRKRNTE